MTREEYISFVKKKELEEEAHYAHVEPPKMIAPRVTEIGI